MIFLSLIFNFLNMETEGESDLEFWVDYENDSPEKENEKEQP